MELHIRVLEAKGLPKMDTLGSIDPYVKLQVGNEGVKKTRTINDTYSPHWNETFDFYSIAQGTPITLRVFDHDVVGSDDEACWLKLNTNALVPGRVVDSWYPLTGKKNGKNAGQIHLMLHLCPRGAKPFVNIQQPMMMGQPGMMPTQPMMGQPGMMPQQQMMSQPGMMPQQPMMGQPGMMQPGMMTQQPMMGQPGMMPQQPGMMQPQPMMGQPGMMQPKPMMPQQPMMGQPGMMQPQPMMGQPGMMQPQPMMSQPGMMQPGMMQPQPMMTGQAVVVTTYTSKDAKKAEKERRKMEKKLEKKMEKEAKKALKHLY